MAETKKDAVAALEAFVETYQIKYERAADCLTKDRDALLAFYDFPAEHWKHLRTTNPIESTFATVRHRTIRSKGCLSNKTALAMVYISVLLNPGRTLTAALPSPHPSGGDPAVRTGLKIGLKERKFCIRAKNNRSVLLHFLGRLFQNCLLTLASRRFDLDPRRDAWGCFAFFPRLSWAFIAGAPRGAWRNQVLSG